MAGSNVTLADLVLLPFMERFDMCMREFRNDFDLRCEGGCGDITPVGKWLELMEKRPAAKKAAADPAKLLAAFKRYRSLDFFDYVSMTKSTL